jgi:2-polyprenyl-3-methyl-5-hydroxy-6-metoxy-1,4-benzoquinol methylase
MGKLNIAKEKGETSRMKSNRFLTHTTQIRLPAVSSAVPSSIAPAVNEPFSSGRAAPKLLMVSLLKPSALKDPVLDFGAGTGWVSEFCCRMNLQVVSFDIHGDLQACLENRVLADSRVDGRLLSFARGDGHCMPFESGVF